MIYLIREGDARKNGINIYHPDQRKHSIGFTIKLGKFACQARYSRHLKRLLVTTWR